MYDVIDDPQSFDDSASESSPYLALEWMDLTLADLRPIDAMHNYILMKAVMETVMSSFVVLDSQKRVNTGAANVSV